MTKSADKGAADTVPQTTHTAPEKPKASDESAPSDGLAMTEERSTSPEPTPPAGLRFDTDKGASRSTWIAALLTLALVGWMGSGFVVPSEDPEEEATAPNTPLAVAVAVQQSVAQPVTLYFNAEGQALPDRDTLIRAEASGEISELLVSMGDYVEEGTLIARISSERAEAQLVQAQQEVTRTQRDLENAQTLLERGVATVDRVEQARSAFTQAAAQLTAAEEALADMAIVAPFAGRIEALDIDTGEFVQAGAEIGRIVDNSPLTVSFRVPQQALGSLESGLPANVTFITGETREATVTFVGTAAAQSTRTFLAEVSLPNEDGAIAAGISAEITIPTAEVTAHFLSPSIVSLSPDGQLGIKAVDAENIVRFYPIEIVRAEINGIWVSGLPDEIDLITVGQGYVSDGEEVRPQVEEAS
ncbi:efflux RND transporter periplasmic adaptor subunit [Gymnodinialimonas sp. 57CJ19]|uniref:efflux RND transporter periplasmic adaptor subunit n=1 Tax=Gymnodinialimonas sp. 57CJ19 TaxID=3138498 RepID=UPI0031345AB2